MPRRGKYTYIKKKKPKIRSIEKPGGIMKNPEIRVIGKTRNSVAEQLATKFNMSKTDILHELNPYLSHVKAVAQNGGDSIMAEEWYRCGGCTTMPRGGICINGLCCSGTVDTSNWEVTGWSITCRKDIKGNPFGGHVPT